MVRESSRPLKNQWRERVQTETKRLRELVATLESERDWLLVRRHFKCDVRSPDGVFSVEQENEALREELARQRRVGELLMCAIAGRPVNVDECFFRAGGDVIWPSKMLHDDLDLRFAQLRDQVERAYRDVDDVVKMEKAPCNFFTTTNSRFVDGCVQPVLEGFETVMIPLDLAKCSKALWQASHHGLWAGCGDVEFYGDDPSCRMQRVRWMRDSFPLTCTLVTKQFVENERVIVAWRCVTSMGENENNYVEEVGWSVMMPVKDASGREFVARTLHIEWVPRSMSGRSRLVADLESLVVAVTRRNTTAVDEMMENLLIEECMADGMASNI